MHKLSKCIATNHTHLNLAPAEAAFTAILVSVYILGKHLKQLLEWRVHFLPQTSCLWDCNPHAPQRQRGGQSGVRSVWTPPLSPTGQTSLGQISAVASRDASWPRGNLWDSLLTHNCALLDEVEEERNHFTAINPEKFKYSFLYDFPEIQKSH